MKDEAMQESTDASHEAAAAVAYGVIGLLLLAACTVE